MAHFEEIRALDGLERVDSQPAAGKETPNSYCSLSGSANVVLDYF